MAGLENLRQDMSEKTERVERGQRLAKRGVTMN